MASREWIRVGGALAVLLVGLATLGVAGMGLAATNLEHYGQDPYFVEIDRYETPTPVDAIDYEDLPPAAQRAFRDAVAGEVGVLWSDDDARAIEVLGEHNVIRYEGQVYPYGLGHADNFGSSGVTILALVALVGAILTGAGGRWVVGRYRSATPPDGA